METHDGFTIEEWNELARAIFERSSFAQDGLKTANPSKSMLDHQLRLRSRASKKFSDSDRWLWTAKLLEQSSDEKVAALTAAAFPQEVRAIDFCSGAGSDSVAIARRGPLTAVDRCEVACGLTRANLAMHFPDQLSIASPTVNVVCANAESVEIPRDTWVHIDPDRRANSRRTIQANLFQPGLDFLSKAINNSAGGSIKLAPATKFETSKVPVAVNPSPPIDIDLQRIGRQFVTWGGSVRQQRWWWNVEIYPASTITLSILTRVTQWHHWTVANKDVFEFDEWSNSIEDWRGIQGYIGDADSCVRAAGLQAFLAEKLEASLIGNPVGFFQIDRLDNVMTPLVDWFQIDATMAFDRKRLRSYLRERNIGVLEIKVRNVELDPALLRKEMKLRGSEAATLLVTRCGLKTVAIVARRIQSNGVV